MTSKNLSNHPEVVLIYQDREYVEPAIQQIMSLELEFQAFKYNPKKMQNMAELQPKVLLLSSNDVKRTIQLYIDYLEEYEQNIAPHSAVLLINNRETYQAYLACENGLFDNYVIINPLNEPYRLKLALLQELKIIEKYQNQGLEQLVDEGEEQLASCIEHGVALKKSFLNHVNECSDSIIEATKNTDVPEEKSEILNNLIALSLDEMNENVASDIEHIIAQLNELKVHQKSLKQNIEKLQKTQKKTVTGNNVELLKRKSRYKILIAEPSDLFADVVEDIFSATAFEYLLVNDGQTMLNQISSFKPDIVLLAYDIGTINGIEVTRKIRDEGNKVPIVAYMHERDKAVIKRWVPLGLSGYIIKPSKKSVILKVIINAIKNPIEVILHNKSSNTAEIQWSEKYSVGNKELDEQHKVLFSMTNEFFQQEGKDSANILFDSLSSYIDLHFESEENLLKQINYPDTDKHIEKHEELRQKFTGLSNKLNDYDVDMHHKIAIFLYNWLANHILKSDMAYKSYAQSIEASNFE